MFTPLNSSWFAPDLKFIRRLAKATSLKQARDIILDFSDVNEGPGNWRRAIFKIRVSGEKAARMAERIFAKMGERGDQHD